MRKLWDDEKFVNDNTLSVNVNRLRLKLEEIGLEEVIVTKKGLGYIAITKGGAMKLFLLYIKERISLDSLF